MRTQPSEDGVGDAAVHGEFDVRSDSCAISGKQPFDNGSRGSHRRPLTRNYVTNSSTIFLQDIESSRSYIDELYSPDAQKCLEAIM